MAGRLPVVRAIKALTKEIAATYKDPEPPSTANSPPSTAQPPASKLEALQMLHNTRSNITKWTKKSEQAAAPDEARRCKQRLDTLCEQKLALESFLKNVDE